MDQRGVDSGADDATRAEVSRRWEIELLISGATLFALLQAPGWVDGWYARTQPHLDGGTEFVAFFGFYSAKLILYTLICTFLLHLIARAYWVALVGLHSVFPAGTRWSELEYGPAFTERIRGRISSTPAAIRRMDNLSSLLFSGGAVILLMFFTSLLIIVPMVALSMLVSRTLFGGEYLPETVLALVLTLTMIPVLTRYVDLRWGRRNPGTRPPAALQWAAGLSFYLGATTVTGPLALVLSSNLGKRAAWTTTTLIFMGIIGLFVVRDVLLQRGLLQLDGHAYLSDAVAAQETVPAHYADQRAADVVYPLTPHIQSETVTDAYVRLFVPITPVRHNPLVAERCPSVPLRGSGLRLVTERTRSGSPPDAAAFIECVAGLQPVSLNGQRLDGAPWRLATDPASGLRGIVLHIPAHDLPAGEHLLRIEGLPRPAREQERRNPRPDYAPHLIRFWR